MKKSIVIVLALLAVFSSVQCDSSEEILGTVKSKHVKKLLTKNKDEIDEGFEKLEKHCPGVTNKLKEAVKSFLECDDKVDDSLTICQQIQTSALNCTAPLLKVVDDCLPSKTRGLPKLGLESLISLADYLCKQSGESIFELVNPCLWDDTDDDLANEDDECEDKAINALDKLEKAVKSDDTQKLPDKAEVCTTVTSFRSCLQRDTNTRCKNQKTKDVVLGVYDALVAPCSHINEV